MHSSPNPVSERSPRPQRDRRFWLDIWSGWQPAFAHRVTGETHLALADDGQPDSVHSFNGLPDDWVVERDAMGMPVALHPDIVAGYWRACRFIALGTTVALPLDA